MSGSPFKKSRKIDWHKAFSHPSLFLGSTRMCRCGPFSCQKRNKPLMYLPHSTVHNISSIRQNGPYRQNFMRHPLSISWCTLTAYHFLSNTGNFLVCSRSFWLPLLQRKKEPKGSFFLWANRECSIKKMSVKGYLSSMHKISTAFCAWSWFSASS